MKEYDKILDLVEVKYLQAEHNDVLLPMRIGDFSSTANHVILVREGEVTFGTDDVAKPGDVVFVPSGQQAPLAFGDLDRVITITNEEFHANRDRYFQKHNSANPSDLPHHEAFSFDARIYGGFSFFRTLNITPFIIRDNPKVRQLVESVLEEAKTGGMASARVLNAYSEQMMVEAVRYMFANRIFVERVATHMAHFKDERLIKISTHIRNNLGGDLANKRLAHVADVSEDYVGQYFKMLTGINPQDFIEYQRMHHAVNLLRQGKLSIREIGHAVGYKDTAYFCRRFKMLFGIPAGKLRKRYLADTGMEDEFDDM